MFLEEKREGEIAWPQLAPSLQCLMRREKTSEEIKADKLKGFIHILRHSELWPANFAWNYHCCDHCAMGMAFELGYVSAPLTTKTAEAFGLSYQQAYWIFNLGNPNWFGLKRVKPEQIARALEKLT
jgi:hypothetical protein